MNQHFSLSKRIVSLFLALALLQGLALPGFAEGAGEKAAPQSGSPATPMSTGGTATGDTATPETGSISIDSAHFPDAGFRSYVSVYCDSNFDGKLSQSERDNVSQISIYHEICGNLQGVEYFSELTLLNVYDNQLTSLDVTYNTKLTDLDVDNNRLTSLNLSKNSQLQSLHCSCNSITALDLSKNSQLESLYCASNNLTALNVTHNAKLHTLNANNNKLTTLDLSRNPELTALFCWNNSLTSLDITHNAKLGLLICSNNKLSSLDVSHNSELFELEVDQNQLEQLDLSKCTKLTVISCSKNNLRALDVNACVDLKDLTCSSNRLKELKTDKCTKLEYLGCIDNSMPKINLSCVLNQNYHNLRQCLGAEAAYINGVWQMDMSELVGSDTDRVSVKAQNGSQYPYYKDGIMYISDSAEKPYDFVYQYNTTGVGTNALMEVYVSLGRASAVISNVTIEGVQGLPLSSPTFTIIVGNDEFNATNADVTRWFTNLPVGLKATATYSQYNRVATVQISGTPLTGATGPIQVVIPGSELKNNTEKRDIAVTANANAKWSISPVKVVVKSTVEVTPSLRAAGITTVQQIVTALNNMLAAQNGFANASTATMEVELYIVQADGTQVLLTPENFPAGGIDILLPYPDGTNSSYNFAVSHMLHNGTVEALNATAMSDLGILVHISSASPFGIAWTAKSSGHQKPDTDDYTIKSWVTAGGTITPSATVKAGENATFVAQPNAGYKLVKIVVDGVDLGPVSSYTFFAVHGNHEIGAYFDKTTTAAAYHSPATGDESPLMLWVILLAAAAVGLITVGVLRRKKQE